MKNDRQLTGRKGEDEGCNYLTEHGYTVIERNWRSGHLELDIIALGCDGLHFVEVKSRTAPVMAEPEVNVDGAKRKRLVAAARSYLRSNPAAVTPDMEIFFDVLTVVFDKRDMEIELYTNAFTPIYV